jgi:Zn-dependent protease with chaperone function
MTDARRPAALTAEYFDGLSARAHPVRLSRKGDALHIEGAGIDTEFSLDDLEWPERTRHGTRVVQLGDGASLQADDSEAWDEFARDCGRSDSTVVRAQQSWRWVLASLALVVMLLAAAYQWGVPSAARAAVVLVPLRVETEIGASALQSLDGSLLQPSRLPLERQLLLRVGLERVLSAQPAGTVPAHRLEFRSSRIGPNAFALPGGTVVMTDELVDLLGGDVQVIAGVLAHELGHVQHRHGVRLLLQAGAIGAVASVVLGDFSSLLAAAPVVLGQAAYSRDAEREADAHAVKVLRNAGISPAVMVTFFAKIAQFQRDKRGRPDKPPAEPSSGEPRESPSWLGIAIASHPADAQRVRFFQDAAGGR